MYTLSFKEAELPSGKVKTMWMGAVVAVSVDRQYIEDRGYHPILPIGKVQATPQISKVDHDGHASRVARLICVFLED